MKVDSSELLRPSLIALIAANLFPVYGVVFLGWEVFPLLMLFWLENIIIGGYNVLKMLLAAPGEAAGWGEKLFVIPFFCVHYGMFAFGHGLFLFGVFGGYFREDMPFPADVAVVFQIIREAQVAWAVLALAVSHGLSFVLNYIGRGEYRQVRAGQLMAQPYARVVLLHVTIILGGFLLMVLQSPIAGLLLLLVLKTVLDIRAHLREHAKYRSLPKP
jgi:hypothetical protein